MSFLLFCFVLFLLSFVHKWWSVLPLQFPVVQLHPSQMQRYNPTDCSDKGQCASTVDFIFFYVLQYSPRNMFLSPVSELSRNEKKCFLASFARSTSHTVLWKKLISGNRGVAEDTATSSQISHNILSQTEHNMFIPPPPSNMEFLLKFLDLQNIFWTCSPNCSSWAGGWALVAEVWSHTLFSTCATRQQTLCSLLLFSTAQFWPVNTGWWKISTNCTDDCSFQYYTMILVLIWYYTMMS